MGNNLGLVVTVAMSFECSWCPCHHVTSRRIRVILPGRQVYLGRYLGNKDHN